MKYFPFLRGKRGEMRALKNVAAEIAGHKDVIPIIEPVRDGFLPVYDTFTENAMPFVLICNPEVGRFKDEHPLLETKIISEYLLEYRKWLPALYVNWGTSYDDIIGFSEDYFNRDCALIYHQTPRNEVLDELGTSAPANIRYHIYFEGVFLASRVKQFPSEKRVGIVDSFKRKVPNAEYREPEMELFTERNTLVANPDNENFGDFSVQGDHYQDSGGGDAYTIAVHHVHFNTDTASNPNALYISHFLSETKLTAGHRTGMTYQAVDRLCKALGVLYPNDTAACDEYRELQRRGDDTNLETLKRLSIQHHLEVMLSERGLEG